MFKYKRYIWNIYFKVFIIQLVNFFLEFLLSDVVIVQPFLSKIYYIEYNVNSFMDFKLRKL